MHRAARLTLAGLGATGLILGSTVAPAAAGYGYDHYGKVNIKVCKYVEDDDYDDDYDDDESFKFKVYTDKGYDRFYLEDGECEYVKLKFYEHKFTIKEYVDEDDYEVDFDVYSDTDFWTDEDQYETYAKLKVSFDEDEYYPKFTVDVDNKVVDDDDDDDY